MRTISKLILALLLFTALIFLSAFYTAPKAIILDKLLMERGIHIIAGRVEEGAFSTNFEKVRLFFRNEAVAEVDRLSLSFGLTGVSLIAKCGNGVLRGRVFVNRSLKLHAREFKCIKGVGKLEGDIELKEGVFGKLKIAGLKTQGVVVDSANFEFKGDKFSGSVEYLGMTLTGGGKLKLNMEDPMRSKLEASFKGSLGTLTLRGELKNISIQVR